MPNPDSYSNHDANHDAPHDATLIAVTVNGQSLQFSPSTTVRALIEFMGLGSIPCAAEVNTRLVRRSEQSTRMLQPGDTIELVSLVGGG